MKKIFAILLSTIYCLLSIQVATATWWIDSYNTRIEVQENSTLLITETIEANFSEEAHHGIYRIIPNYITKEDGTLEKLRLKLISITDGEGNKYNYSTSSTPKAVQYKIGSPETLIQTPKTYIITYQVSNGLLYFDDHNEVYWDSIGTAWETNIKNATTTIILPETLTINDEIDAICYAGSLGSNEQSCSYTQTNTNQIDFKTTDTLSPYQGFTIAVSFPLGHTTPPSSILWVINDYWPVIIVPIVFIILFIQWKNHGKNKRTHTIVPIYEPPHEMSPIEVAIILDGRADNRDISAVMIDLAVRGFIKIEEVEEKKLGLFNKKDYRLHRTNPNDEKSLKDFEKELLGRIFGKQKSTRVSTLKNKFHTHLEILKRKMVDSAMEKKLFEKRPETVKSRYAFKGMGITILGFFIVPFINLFNAAFALGISIIISGILVIVFGYYMPKKTDEGQRLYEKVLGLRMYIETAEKDRIKFHERREHFEKLLPYAMIFKQTNHWAKQFEDIYKEPPDWYESNMWLTEGFMLSGLINSLDNATSAMNSAMSSMPNDSGGSGFGGGGSVGGGSGGGGGGSW